MSSMTEEEKILYIRLLIGDSEGSAFYPLYTDEEIELILKHVGGDIKRAVMRLAIGASFKLSGVSTRERAGAVEVWNELSRNYLRALQNLLTELNKELPSGVMPYVAGVSRKELCYLKSDSDFLYSKLLDIYTCDSDNPCGEGCGKC